jgi:hypothetical protein
MPVGTIAIRGTSTSQMAKNVNTAATTSPEDSIPADTRPKLPVTAPMPSLSATSTLAAAIETSAVRNWPLPASTRSIRLAEGGRVLSAFMVQPVVALLHRWASDGSGQVMNEDRSRHHLRAVVCATGRRRNHADGVQTIDARTSVLTRTALDAHGRGGPLLNRPGWRDAMNDEPLRGARAGSYFDGGVRSIAPR